jgi:carbamoyl-phosphate synthase large subunit
MPKREDIEKIIVLGSGPIIIGQACEFDYSGTQALKALKEVGYEIVLVNSNPATIMTDPEFSDRTYIEPLSPEYLEKICRKEQADALLPTLGGQTGLNLAVQLSENGVLDELGLEMIGAQKDVIQEAEDRKKFKQNLQDLGLNMPNNEYAYNLKEAREILEDVGLPCVIRSSFTLGGTGGGIAYNIQEFDRIVSHGLNQSMINEVLIEEYLVGWKEYELEVMRDTNDNVVIVCGVENIDPMGVHTGESITCAPTQTLSDREYQRMRNASLDIMRKIGVETGGSNIQFAFHQETGEMSVIEMNPRVSRSSALASKATGFPIAKIAALLAVGFTLDEIQNDITRETPACFEPTIDYTVVKTPRWEFEKFPGADENLTVQMKSIGEAMAIGRNFKEALQKSLRSIEKGYEGIGPYTKEEPQSEDDLLRKVGLPREDRIFAIYRALKAGISVDEINERSQIDKWFLYQIKEIILEEEELAENESLEDVSDDELHHVKRHGFSDNRIGELLDTDSTAVRKRRKDSDIIPTYKVVDTCGGEFEAYTPYYYSTYGKEDELDLSDDPKIVILGAGPNRIGQAIEFDYCCVQAAFALDEMGYETVMVNSNPETVSTDYDTSDMLFFEPLTEESVMNICDKLDPDGVIVQFGGQTPLNISSRLLEAGIPVIGTHPNSIDRSEDRERFSELIEKLDLLQPPGDLAVSLEEAKEICDELGYPVLVRPSYVLGGRSMEIVYDERELEQYVKTAVDTSPDHPILIDRFIENATEVDVDALADGEQVVVAGILEHIEEAGTHSGDTTMTLPPHSLSDEQIDEIRDITRKLGKELDVKGCMNIQLAVKGDDIYVIEVNPRASRTIPFISKATGIPLAKYATRIMAGETLDEIGFTEEVTPNYYCVKKSVFPFDKFPGADITLGPAMKSTGEVMGIDPNIGCAFAKAEISASEQIPTEGNVFISVKDQDKQDVVNVAQKFDELGFDIKSTSGTAHVLSQNGLDVEVVNKLREGRPHSLDLIINGEIDLIINTPSGKGPRTDEARIREKAITHDVPVVTTLPGAQALAASIEAVKYEDIDVRALQDVTQNVSSAAESRYGKGQKQVNKTVTGSN